MEYLIIIACVIISTISYIRNKNIFSPELIFSFFWMIIIFFASLRLRGEHKADLTTMLIYFIGISSFCLSCILLNNKIICIRKYSSVINKIYKLNYRAIYIICIFVLVYSTIKYIRVIPFIKAGIGMGQIRQAYWTVGSGITTSALDYFLDNTINKGLQLAIMIIATTEFASGKKNNFLMFTAIFSVIISAATSGGRIIFFDFMIFVCMSLVIYRKKIKISKKVKRGLVIIGVAGAISMVYLTTLRQGTISFFEALYADFTCNVPLMNQAVNLVNENGHITYGAVFIRGIIEPIVAILQPFGLVRQPESFSILATYIQPFYHIGGENYANAYTSSFFYFYLDGRLIGVALYSFIYGVICKNCYNYMKLNFNCKTVAIYLLFVNTIFRSMIRFSFSVPYYIIAFIVITLVYKKSKRGNIA